ncbi:MAG: SPOR domain-containing protein [Alphaproteobacteria bacterium]|nr:SPOR domain-containing protein [Alphaproteobacteria bacterium]MBV9694987.1 SPOR domain-containing protein [Alphaproteobacteria bacterium]
MANQGRGTYEPPDDVHIFDASEEDDTEGSRLPLLIVISLVVIAAFGGVVWLAYNQGVARGRTDSPKLITAQSGPAKVAADQGGADNAYKGLKIYQQPAPADDQADQRPAPPPSRSAPDTTVVTPAVTAQDTAPAPQKPVQQAEAAKPKPVEPPAPEIRSTTPPSTDQTPTAPPQQLGLKPKAESAAPPAAAPSAPASGGYVLQIGAYKSKAEAEAAWKTYQAHHAATLGGYTRDVKEVDLGAKGTWYRLRVGAFASKADAAALCQKLTAEGGACFPAK